ncbi:hypothetical protein C7M84_007329 [Penaeus vannamei]|uniref:Integrase catalytic domain-containing protein n=1 Tax=Penaeus vannamei TaxID=6689 RepID=A0A3R7PJU5_PENVA|nr:hypothetical protein C7M84_007329 [Penaeus vannamei]
MLSQSKMIPGQSPLDYFQAVEMAILQGAKDYPYEVGDVEALLRRTFTAGLPTWLRHQLLLLDFTTTSQMAQKCQAAWDATVGIKTFLPTIRSASHSSYGLYPPHKQVGTVQQIPRQKHVMFDSPPSQQQMDGPSPSWSRHNNSIGLHPDSVLTHRTCVATGVYFPGDILLGMDLLHRLSFRLVHSPTSNLLERDGYHHQITSTGEESKCLHEAPAEEDHGKHNQKIQCISPVHVAERTVVPAQSGYFVPANLTRGVPSDARFAIIEGNATCLTVPRTLISVHEQRSSVWVVNTDLKARKVSPDEPREELCPIVQVADTKSAVLQPDTQQPDEELEVAAPPMAAQSPPVSVSPLPVVLLPTDDQNGAPNPCLVTMDSKQMRQEQMKDSICKDLIGWLEGEYPLPKHYTWLTVPHLRLIQVLFEHTTTSAIIVLGCVTCQRRKGSAPQAPLQCHPLSAAPLELVSADLMDLRSSARGFHYVLSIFNHHTRFLQLVSLRDKSASCVLGAFVNHFVTLFGPPAKLHTDNGMEFSSAEWRSVLSALSVKHSFSVAYHPQSNGMVERTNRTVKDALAALVWRSPSQWPLYLPAVCFALNSAIHRSVSEQPLYLFTGRMAFFPRGLTNVQVVDEGLMVQRLTDGRRLAVEVSQQVHETG